MRFVLFTLVVAGCVGCGVTPEPRSVRFATFNVSMFRSSAGDLGRDLRGGGDPQARAIAAILQIVRPDVVLLNEFDFDEPALDSFRSEYLGISQFGHEPLHLRYSSHPTVNTGEPSGHDLDRDGAIGGAGDAFGFGGYPGQYGMALLSRLPIDAHRAFRHFLWRDMPDSRMPVEWFDAAERAVVRLSSKSHLDVSLRLRGGRLVHVLISHPTPPVFDGPEDRNGRRNFDEIRFWADYVRMGAAGYIVDDTGVPGGIAGEPFVVLGDLNADPNDGEARASIRQLLDHPRIAFVRPPSSRGGVVAAIEQGGVNAAHRGDAAFDTADFADTGAGNLRVDYVLPSAEFAVRASGVFWPVPGHPHHALLSHSDHRLVWCDLELR